MEFEELFKSWTLEQKVKWALGQNICNLSENMRSIIVDLKAENEQLKKDLEHARSYKHTIKMRNRNLHTENERLKGENAMLNEEREKLKETIRQCDSFTLDFYKGLCDRLHKENAKLKCLALHTMSEYCFAQGTIIHTKLEFTEQSIDEDRKMIHKVNIRDRWGEYFAEAYRKVKKELMGGK